MITNDRESFEELEIEHNNIIYYANGYVDYKITEDIGGDYEGYAFEKVYDSEISDITINALWYYDENTGKSVEVLCKKEYGEIEKIVEEVVMSDE